MKLHCFKGEHNAAKILALVSAVGGEISLNYILDKEDRDFLNLSPFGRTPVFESDLDPIFNTNTVLRYIARSYKDKGFAGLLPKEEAQIDYYLEICAKELDPLVEAIYKPYKKMAEFDGNQEESLIKLSKILVNLEETVLDRNYLVGYGLTLADVVICVTLTCPFQAIYDRYYEQEFPNLTNYLKRVFKLLRLENIPKCFRELDIDLEEAEKLIGGGISHFKEDLIEGVSFEPRNEEKENQKKKKRKSKKKKKKSESSDSSSSDSECSEESRKGKKSKDKKKKRKRLRKKLKKLKKAVRRLERELDSSSSSSSSESSDTDESPGPSKSREKESLRESIFKEKKKETKKIKKTQGSKEISRKDDMKESNYLNRITQVGEISKQIIIQKSDFANPSDSNQEEYSKARKLTPENQRGNFYENSGTQSVIVFPSKSTHNAQFNVDTPSQNNNNLGYYRNITPEKPIEQKVKVGKRTTSEKKIYSPGAKIVIDGTPNARVDLIISNPILVNTSISNTKTPAVVVKGIPVVAQSYKTVDMSLLNLRANFNTVTPEKKEGVIQEFELTNEGKKFYSINLTKFGQETDINIIDEQLREVLPDMIVARVGELGIKKYVMGGLTFSEIEKIEGLDLNLFEIEEQSLRNPEVEKTILAALQNVMRTPSVDI